MSKVLRLICRAFLAGACLVAGLAGPAVAEADNAAATDIRAGVGELIGAFPDLDPPTVTVSQTTDLADGQTLSATVVTPAGWYYVRQCGPNHGDPCVSLTGNGFNITTEFMVYRHLAQVDLFTIFTTGDASGAYSTVDCAIVVCKLSFYGRGPNTEVPLSFDPDAPLRTPGQLTIDSPLLYDGEAITIDGTGFRADTTAAVGLCHGPNPSGLLTFDVVVAAQKCALLELADTDDQGAFSISQVVRANDTTYFDGIDFDCNVVACWIGAATTDLQSGFTSDITFISEDLANAAPEVLERLTRITVGQRLDQVHMAETKQGE